MKRIDCEWESLLADGHCTARVYLDKALERIAESVDGLSDALSNEKDSDEY